MNKVSGACLGVGLVVGFIGGTYAQDRWQGKREKSFETVVKLYDELETWCEQNKELNPEAFVERLGRRLEFIGLTMRVMTKEMMGKS